MPGRPQLKDLGQNPTFPLGYLDRQEQSPAQFLLQHPLILLHYDLFFNKELEASSFSEALSVNEGFGDLFFVMKSIKIVRLGIYISLITSG